MSISTFSFGVRTLDELFFSPKISASAMTGIVIPPTRPAGTDEGAISIAIAGPPGSGKSILALHLASQRKENAKLATVIYISTDFSYEQANQIYQQFKLNHDASTDPITERAAGSDEDSRNNLKRYSSSELVQIPPEKIANLSLLDDSKTIFFLDLKNYSGGDEWLLSSRLTALLACRAKNENQKPTVIIDAIEGLHLLAGEKDSFGFAAGPRSRLAALIRAAQGHCHLILTVEDDTAIKVSPEEFVTDVVLRVGIQNRNNYTERYLEIQKCRTGGHALGRHAFVIRSGSQTSTLTQINADKPEVGYSYIHVIQSLNFRASQLQHSKSQRRNKLSFQAKFNITHLDDMLHRNGGLPSGHVCGLIGEEGTHKSRISRAFLANGISFNGMLNTSTFDGFPAVYLSYGTRDDLHLRVPIHALTEYQAAKFITAQARNGLGSRFSVKWVRNLNSKLTNPKSISPQILWFRRLHGQGTSADTLIDILLRNIQAALWQLLKRLSNLSGDDRGILEGQLNVSDFTTLISQSEEALREFPYQPVPFAPLLRVVVDDLSTFQSVFPDTVNNAAFTGFLVDILKSIGCTTLIIDTQPGDPDSQLRSDRDATLRTHLDHVLYTWTFRFGAEARVAVAALPPISDNRRSLIRELKGSQGELDDRLYVDRHLELYSFVRGSEPIPIQLELMLLDEYESSTTYLVKAENIVRSACGIPFGSESLINQEVKNNSERLSQFLRRRPKELAVPRSLVVQIDEWLFADSSKGRSILDQLHQITPRSSDWPIKQFQAPGDEKEEGTRAHPLYWSFGFLMLRARNWAALSVSQVDHFRLSTDGGPDQAVFDLVKYLAKSCRSALIDGEAQVVITFPTKNKLRIRSDWITFLSACRVAWKIQRSQTSEGIESPFGLSLNSRESVNSLILEVWLSTAQDFLMAGAAGKTNLSWINGGFSRALFEGWKIDEDPTSCSVAVISLYLSLMAISEAIDASLLPIDEDEFDIDNLSVAEVGSRTMAIRAWYSTACRLTESLPHDPFVPVQLPGHYSTRGDWYIGSIKEGRSHYLSELAINALCGHRATLHRLDQGVGLPFSNLVDGIATHFENAPKHRLRTAIRTTAGGDSGRVLFSDLLKIAPVKNRLPS